MDPPLEKNEGNERRVTDKKAESSKEYGVKSRKVGRAEDWKIVKRFAES